MELIEERIEERCRVRLREVIKQMSQARGLKLEALARRAGLRSHILQCRTFSPQFASLVLILSVLSAERPLSMEEETDVLEAIGVGAEKSVGVQAGNLPN